MKLSDSQRAVLKAAAKKPKTDVREFMKHIKSSHIRDKAVTALLNNGLIMEDPDAEGVVYVISEAGFAAIGKNPPAHKPLLRVGVGVFADIGINPQFRHYGALSRQSARFARRIVRSCRLHEERREGRNLAPE